MRNDIKRHKRQYDSQKQNAKRRGIDWQFTFESWLKFWGDDIDSRGQGHDRLCMQRFGDMGPYHPDNVKKGYARDNRRTAAAIQRSRNINKGVNFSKRTDEDLDIVRKTFYPD